MYSVFLLFFLVCGSDHLEQLVCQVDELKVTEVSATSLTVAWTRPPLTSCVNVVVYLSEENAKNLVEIRIIRFLNSTSFTGLDPCSRYFVDVSPLPLDAKFHFHKSLIVVESNTNLTRLSVFRDKEGTYVFNSDKSLIANVSSDNSKCYQKVETENATAVTEAETAAMTTISEPTGITSTTTFMIQSTKGTDLTNTTETADIVETPDIAETVAGKIYEPDGITSATTFLTQSIRGIELTSTTETADIVETADISESAAATVISEPDGITSTTTFMMQSMRGKYLTNTTTSTATADTTMESSTAKTTTTAETTPEKTNSSEPTTAPQKCTLQDAPTEIEDLKVTLTSENSVKVTWSEPACTSGLYFVNLSYDGRLDVREVRLIVRRNSTQFLGLGECRWYTVSVTPLTGDSILQKTDAALSLVTRLSWIRAVDVITAVKSNETVSNLKASGITTSSMEMTWTPTPYRDCYNKDRRFYVEIEHYGSDDNATADINGKSQYAKTNKLKLTGLESCATYKLSVTVGFVRGYKSAKRSSIVVTTLPDKIKNLTAVSVTPTSILVSWTAPAYWDCGAEKEKYFVRLESFPTPKFWHTDTPHVLLSGLTPCTSHEISVSLFFVGEVNSSLKSSIVVNTLSDSFTDCISASLSANKATVTIAFLLCIILITVIVFAAVLRYRGLTIGGKRWEVTDDWCVVRETIRVRNSHHMNTITFQKSSAEVKIRDFKARTL